MLAQELDYSVVQNLGRLHSQIHDWELHAFAFSMTTFITFDIFQKCSWMWHQKSDKTQVQKVVFFSFLFYKKVWCCSTNPSYKRVSISPSQKPTPTFGSDCSDWLRKSILWHFRYGCPSTSANVQLDWILATSVKTILCRMFTHSPFRLCNNGRVPRRNGPLRDSQVAGE